MPPYLTPLQIFENYKKANPQKCKGKSATEICRLAGLSDKQIAELKTTSAWLFCFDKENTSISQDFSMTEIMGGYFKNKKTDINKQSPIPYKFKIEKNAEGKNSVPLSQFELPNLQKIFNKQFFDINTNNNSISIIDKKNKKIVLKIEKIFDFADNFAGYKISQEINSKKTITEINNSGFYEKETVYNKNGSYIQTDFQFCENLPLRKTSYDKNNKKWYILYDFKGREYKKEYANGKVENYLVNELILDITAKTKLGLPTTRSSLKQHIEQIQWNNAAEVLYTYYETTGRDLITDINEEIGLPKSIRKQLCQQIIEKLQQNAVGLSDSKFSDYMMNVLNIDMSSPSSSTNFDYHITMASMIPYLDRFVDSYNKTNEGKDFLKEINKHPFLKNSKGKERFDENYSRYGIGGAKYLADLLDDDISGLGSGKLEKHIKFIKPYNVEQVMKYYTRPKVLGINVENLLKKCNVTEDEYEYVSTLEPLITAIYDEWGIPEKKRYELMNYVFEQLKLYDRDKPTYYDDIIEDLSNNMNDSIKRKIDLKRLDNRLLSGRDRDFEWTNKISQGSTGDCWLLAGVISIINHRDGEKLMDRIVEHCNNGFIVHLKGVNKKINVSYDEIRSMNHLSNGSYKVVAIEIAVDKYMKENAYADNSIFSNPDFDINGNTASFLYNLVLGNGKICSPNDISDINEFNNQKKVYSIGFSKIIGDKNHKYPGLGIDENGNKVDIVRNHAYAIKGSDKEYVYLINPWDSTVTIKVKWKDIKNLPFPKPDISYAEVE